MGFWCRLPRKRLFATAVLAIPGLIVVKPASAREVTATLTQEGNDVVVSQGGKQRIRIRLNPSQTLTPGTDECLAERTYDEAYLAANCLVVIRGLSTCGGDPAKLELVVFTLNGKRVTARGWQRDRFLAADWRTSPDSDWAISGWSMDGHTEFCVLDSSGKIRKRVVEPAFDSWGEHEPEMGFTRDGSFVLCSPPQARERRALMVTGNGDHQILNSQPEIVDPGFVSEVRSESPTPAPLGPEELEMLSTELRVALASFRARAGSPDSISFRVLDRAGGGDPASSWRDPRDPNLRGRGSVDRVTLTRFALRNLDMLSIRAIRLPPGLSWVDYDDWMKPRLGQLGADVQEHQPPLISLSLPAYSSDPTTGRMEAIGTVTISEGYSGDTYFFGLQPSRHGWAVAWMEHEEFGITVRNTFPEESLMAARIVRE